MRIIKIIPVFCVSMIAFVSQAYAEDYTFTINKVDQQISINDSTSTSAETTLPSGVQITQVQTEAEEWSMDYDHQIIILPMGDLSIPIEINKPEVSLKDNKRGQSTIVSNIRQG